MFGWYNATIRPWPSVWHERIKMVAMVCRSNSSIHMDTATHIGTWSSQKEKNGVNAL